MSTIRDLAEPFPGKFVSTNPSGGGSYVPHGIVKQRMIAVLGAPPEFRLVELIRGDVAAIEPNPNGRSERAKRGAPALTNVVVGAVCRMTVFIDHAVVTVEDAGDCEDPHNWPHDGARAKDAFSDAYKRCAADLGVGLHLWQKRPEDYFLYDYLTKAEAGAIPPREELPGGKDVEAVREETSPSADVARRSPRRKGTESEQGGEDAGVAASTNTGEGSDGDEPAGPSPEHIPGVDPEPAARVVGPDGRGSATGGNEPDLPRDMLLGRATLAYTEEGDTINGARRKLRQAWGKLHPGKAIPVVADLSDDELRALIEAKAAES